MAYEPTQWRSGDTITSERLNKMEQGIAGSGSGEVYALHTTQTITPAENEGDAPTITFSNVEFREDGMPMWLIGTIPAHDDVAESNNVLALRIYDDEYLVYGDRIEVDRTTGEVTLASVVDATPGK